MNLSEDLQLDATTAIVILIKTKNDNVRYFSGFGKHRIINAWSLAGAKLFLADNPELKIVEDALREKKYLFERQTVGLLKSN